MIDVFLCLESTLTHLLLLLSAQTQVMTHLWTLLSALLLVFPATEPVMSSPEENENEVMKNTETEFSKGQVSGKASTLHCSEILVVFSSQHHNCV